MKSILCVCLFFGAAGHAAMAQTYNIDANSSQVSFVAKGKPGFLKIEGEAAKLSGTITQSDEGWSGQVKADLRPLQTGIDLRDEHMHEKYLETSKFPTADLKISSVKLSPDQSDCSFAGVLTVKSVAHDVMGDCEVEKISPDRMAGKVTFEFDLAHYPVGVPSYLGVTVASTVKIEAKFSALALNVH